MKYLIYILCITLALFLFSCAKKASYKGTVYSRHHIPMSGIIVYFHYSNGGKEQTVGSYKASTDASGYFSFTGKIYKRNRMESVSISVQDSGSYEAKLSGQTSWENQDIILK